MLNSVVDSGLMVIPAGSTPTLEYEGNQTQLQRYVERLVIPTVFYLRLGLCPSVRISVPARNIRDGEAFMSEWVRMLDKAPREPGEVIEIRRTDGDGPWEEGAVLLVTITSSGKGERC